MAPHLVLREPSVDYVLGYEAESSFPRLVEALEQGKDPRGTPHLAYRDGDEILVTPRPSTVLDLSNYPPIEFDGMESEKYVVRGLSVGARVVPVYTSRGCPYRCTFCYNLHYNLGKWRSFPTDWILNTVDELARTFHMDGLMPFDDNFFANTEQAEAILAGVRERGHDLKWSVELRADQILQMSMAQLRRYRELGVSEVFVGLESGSDRILKLFNKGFKTDVAREANKMLAQTEIVPRYSFIIGAPTETPGETLQTVDLATELMDDNPMASVWQFNQYTPYPGTPLYKMAIKHGFQPYESLDDWDISWLDRVNKTMPTSGMSHAKLATIRYAGLFTQPNECFRHRSRAYNLAFKALRAIFKYRLRRHVFFPFIDTWAIGAIYRGLATLNGLRMKRLAGRVGG
jgi:radical SAM superfamily enzyme YgiQ (UPF0313 family)